MNIPRRLLLQFLMVGLLAILPPAPAVDGAQSARILAIGDIHGAYTELLGILQDTGLIDKDRNWSGGTATLIQIGDILDRGAETRACLDLVMKLQNQAQTAGGRIVTLLGNHEAMNIMGDLRYVTPEIYLSFAGAQSEKIRAQAFKDYGRFVSNLSSRSGKSGAAEDAAGRQEWMAAHPPGYFEYRDAMGPKGAYGRWIRKHRVIYRAGDGLFVHAGLNPNLPFRNIGEIEDRVRTELSEFDVLWEYLSDRKLIWKYMTLVEALQTLSAEVKRIQNQGRPEEQEELPHIYRLLNYQSWLCASPDGPLWYRALAQDPEENLRDALKAMLARLNSQFMVGGHTPVATADITARFENRVFLIDTGMLAKYYRGRASALEIINGQFTARYPGGKSEKLAGPGSDKRAPDPIP